MGGLAISTHDVRAVVEAAVAPRHVVAYRTHPHPYRTSHRLDEVDVALDDGSTLELVLKNLSPDALHEDAHRARPRFLADRRREVDVYRTLLADADLGTPACHAAAADEADGTAWLLLERVPGVQLSQVGELAVWDRAAAWLARMHTRLAAAAGTSRLLRYDRAFYRRWLFRAQAFAGGMDGVASAYERAVERLLALPTTVIHGELYPSNVLVDGTRICAVDWESAAVAPGLIDLAALTAGAWSDEQRGRLAHAYYAALPPDGRQAIVDFSSALDCCRLYVALQWLGWSRDWTPPPEHAHDWRQEALAAAERLGA